MGLFKERNAISARRVAKKYASLIKNKNFSSPIRYEKHFIRYCAFGVSLVLSLQYEGGDVGFISGVGDTFQNISNFQCEKDIEILSQQNPSVSNKEGEVRVVTITQSELYESFRSVGLGVQMYTEFLRSYWDKVRKPFIFIPDACDVGQTSQDARRVWKSLSRNKPSSNLCIAILKRP